MTGRMRIRSRYEHRDGFRAIVRAREGRLPFPMSIIESPIYETREHAELWAFHTIVDNYERLGPFAVATVAPYSGPVSVMEIVG